MMTNRRAFPIIPTLFAFGLLVAIFPTPDSELQAQSSNRYAETPDPYFQSSPSPKTDQGDRQAPNLKKPIKVGSPATHTPMEAPQLWMAPETTTQTHDGVGLSKTVSWEAPLTNVSHGNLELTKPLSLQSPHDTLLAPAAESSIIRERSENDNSFAPPETSFGRSSSFSANSFGIDSNTKLIPRPEPANDFSASGSFAPTHAQEKIQTGRKPQLNPVSFESTAKKPPTVAIASSEPIKSFEPGKVLALVGGEPIFVGDLMFEINQVIEKFISAAPEDIKEQRRREMIPQVLPKFVEAKILFVGAMQGVPSDVPREKIFAQADTMFDEQHLEKVLKESGLKTSAEFDAYLRLQGSSLRQFKRKWGQEQLTRFYLSKQLNIDNEVTHQAMLDDYRANIESYAVPAKCRWEQIMIRFDKSSSHAAAKQELVELGNQVVHGANFEAVAKKNSHGYLASDGGQHDWITKGALVLTEIDEAIFSLPIGELSEIIESRDGYHIIRVIERTEATKQSFLEAQVDIKQKILNEKREKAFQEHVKRLKREIPVEYFLNDDTVAN